MSREIHSSGKVLRVSVFINKRLEQDELISLDQLPIAVSEVGEVFTADKGSKVLHIHFERDDNNDQTGHNIFLPGARKIKLHNCGNTGQMTGPEVIKLRPDAKGTYMASRLVRVIFQMVFPPQKWVNEEPGAEDTVEDLYETLI